MPTYTVTFSDDRAAAYEARVVYINQQAALSPPLFPPVMPVADVEALIASYLEPPSISLENWYLSQSL
jgi:hypothetical protein